MKKLVSMVLLILFVIGAISHSAYAEDKLKRAASNTALGWTEIPKAVTQVTKDTDNPFLGITVGLLKGIANTFARTASGVVDIVSLPVNSQEEPIVKETMVN